MNSHADNEHIVLHLFLKMDRPELSASELSLPTAYLKAMYAESFTTERVLAFFEDTFSKLNEACLSEFGPKLSSDRYEAEVLKILTEFEEANDKSKYPLNAEALVFQTEVETVWLKDQGWRYEQALVTTNFSNGIKVIQTNACIYDLPYFRAGNEHAHVTETGIGYVGAQAMAILIRSVLYMLTHKEDQQSKPKELQKEYLATQEHHISALKKLFNIASKLS